MHDRPAFDERFRHDLCGGEFRRVAVDMKVEISLLRRLRNRRVYRRHFIDNRFGVRRLVVGLHRVRLHLGLHAGRVTQRRRKGFRTLRAHVRLGRERQIERTPHPPDRKRDAGCEMSRARRLHPHNREMSCRGA